MEKGHGTQRDDRPLQKEGAVMISIREGSQGLKLHRKSGAVKRDKCKLPAPRSEWPWERDRFDSNPRIKPQKQHPHHKPEDHARPSKMGRTKGSGTVLHWGSRWKGEEKTRAKKVEPTEGGKVRKRVKKQVRGGGQVKSLNKGRGGGEPPKRKGKRGTTARRPNPRPRQGEDLPMSKKKT